MPTNISQTVIYELNSSYIHFGDHFILYLFREGLLALHVRIDALDKSAEYLLDIRKFDPYVSLQFEVIEVGLFISHHAFLRVFIIALVEAKNAIGLGQGLRGSSMQVLHLSKGAETVELDFGELYFREGAWQVENRGYWLEVIYWDVIQRRRRRV